MKKIKIIIGRSLYAIIGRNLPVSHFRIKIIGKYSKWFRQKCGELILDSCGKNVNIYPKSEFSSKVELGDNSDIGFKSRINGKVIIGKNVIMGPEVLIYTTNHIIDNVDIAIKYQGESEEKLVVIGDDSWIGTRVIILPGVIIGKGVVVAAGAIVTKDAPDYSIVAGNPGRVVRFRKDLIDGNNIN